MRFLAVPGVSFGSAVLVFGGFAIVPLVTILIWGVFWTGATIGLLVFRLTRGGRKRRRGDRDEITPDEEPAEPVTTEATVRTRVESLP